MSTKSLKMLKEVERTCITLFYMEDISIDKIAGIVGVQSGTVKSHLSTRERKISNVFKSKTVMTEIDNDKLLRDFFAENKQEIADNGFSRRVMHHLPDRSNRLLVSGALS